MNKKRSAKVVPYPLILLSAALFGVLGVHDFLMKRYVYGFTHLIASIIAWVSLLITGNLLLMIITIPANYILGLVEAFVYGHNTHGTSTTKNKHKSSAKKVRTITIVLWIFSIIFIVHAVGLYYEGTKSVSDGALPEAMAMFFFTPLAIVFTICATISTINNFHKRN